MKKVKKRDIDQDVAKRMKSLYHLTNDDIMRIARKRVNPEQLRSEPSRRGKAFKLNKPKPRERHRKR